MRRLIEKEESMDAVITRLDKNFGRLDKKSVSKFGLVGKEL